MSFSSECRRCEFRSNSRFVSGQAPAVSRQKEIPLVRFFASNSTECSPGACMALGATKFSDFRKSGSPRTGMTRCGTDERGRYFMYIILIVSRNPLVSIRHK